MKTNMKHLTVLNSRAYQKVEHNLDECVILLNT